MNAPTDLSTSWSHAAVDRVRELGSIGAGQAANVFAQLVGRTIGMQVPAVRGRSTRPLAHELKAWDTGIFFEVEGGLGGLLAVFFSHRSRDNLLRILLGERSAAEERSPEEKEESVAALRREEESALREVGNILASSVVSAIADVLGDRVLPSIPTLAAEGAGAVLQSLVSARGGDGGLRIEIEIFDREGELRCLVVLVPDRA
jgi:chemotaxis protein CheC